MSECDGQASALCERFIFIFNFNFIFIFIFNFNMRTSRSQVVAFAFTGIPEAVGLPVIIITEKEYRIGRFCTAEAVIIHNRVN
jgi:hypothetical protein